MPAFMRAFLFKSSTKVELSYKVKKAAYQQLFLHGFILLNTVQCEPEFHSRTASPVRRGSAGGGMPSSPLSHRVHPL